MVEVGGGEGGGVGVEGWGGLGRVGEGWGRVGEGWGGLGRVGRVGRVGEVGEGWGGVGEGLGRVGGGGGGVWCAIYFHPPEAEKRDMRCATSPA